MAYITVPLSTSECLMTLQLNTVGGPMYIISVSSPTLMASHDLKDSFYDELRTAIHKIPTKQCIYILGIFNANVGSDHASWPHQLRHHEFGSVNEYGRRMLELCTEYDLCITKTYIYGNMRKSVTASSLLWSLTPALSSISLMLPNPTCQHTASLHSADYETDHALLCTKIYLTKPKKEGRGILDHKPKKGFNKLHMKDNVLVNQLKKELQCALDASSPTSSSSDS